MSHINTREDKEVKHHARQTHLASTPTGCTTSCKCGLTHNLALAHFRYSFGADTLPVVSVAEGMRFQSIDVGEVADRLVLLIEQGPAAHAPDMGGPHVHTIEEMTEVYLRIRGRKATIQSAALVGDMFNAFR